MSFYLVITMICCTFADKLKHQISVYDKRS